MEIFLWLLLIAFLGFGFNAFSKHFANQGEHKATIHIILQSTEDDLEHLRLEKEFSFATSPRTGDVLNVEGAGKRYVVDWVQLDDDGGIIAVCKGIRTSPNKLEEGLDDFLESGWRRAHSIGHPSLYGTPDRNHKTIATGLDNHASSKHEGRSMYVML